MCLPNFKEFKQIDKDNPLIGYRSWWLARDDLKLKSESRDYIWTSVIEGPHEVKKENSGIYAYNYYNKYNYTYNNNYNYNNSYNYNYNYDNNNNSYIGGIILQYGRTAIHEIGQRSEYAKIQTLFTIRESDAEGPKKFLDWIPIFNKQIEEVAKQFEAKTEYWQDLIERMK